MEIKYEPVFGDQALFDDAPEDCFCVAKNVYDDCVFYREVDRCLFWFDCGRWKPLQFMSCTPIAMRRIIRTPTWTVAEQKAGKLPEVGAKFKARGYAWECVRILNNTILAVVGDSYCGFELNECTPIESPEEKARRERAEWAKKASQFIDDELDCVNLVGEHVMRRFYNAMLSGELPVPVAPEQNK